MATAMPNSIIARPETPQWAARKLLRAARAGALATCIQVDAPGQPFASLVTPATAPDLTVLLLLSDLAEHTRHLRADPRCAILIAGAPETANPQTTPRVTLTGLAERTGDPALKARYLVVHPYAALYADFGDFHIWRLRVLGAAFVGGFARAARLQPDQLSPDPAAVAAIAVAEAAILADCNNNHPDALARIAAQPGDWRMVAVDVDGCDLAGDERVIRVPWSAPVASAAELRAQLARLASPPA